MTRKIFKADFRVICDGACKGNPGPMYASYKIFEGKRPAVAGFNIPLGQGTNNVAEYRALIEALKDLAFYTDAAQIAIKALTIQSDSNLMISQLRGRFAVRDSKLQQLFGEVQGLLAWLGPEKVQFQYVGRDWINSVLKPVGRR